MNRQILMTVDTDDRFTLKGEFVMKEVTLCTTEINKRRLSRGVEFYIRVFEFSPKGNKMGWFWSNPSEIKELKKEYSFLNPSEREEPLEGRFRLKFETVGDWSQLKNNFIEKYQGLDLALLFTKDSNTKIEEGYVEFTLTSEIETAILEVMNLDDLGFDIKLAKLSRGGA